MTRRTPLRPAHDTNAPSGVHLRCDRLLVIEPDRSLRHHWATAGEVHQVEFVGGPSKLAHALRRPGPARAVSIALAERTELGPRALLWAELQAVPDWARSRVIVDARRCDLATALAMVAAGCIVCADDEEHHGSAPRAAVNHATMADHLGDLDARSRLLKTFGASAISDEHGLTPSQHRVLRGLMDCGDTELARRVSLAPSTVRTHKKQIRKKVGADTIEDILRAAERVACEAAFAMGRLKL